MIKYTSVVYSESNPRVGKSKVYTLVLKTKCIMHVRFLNLPVLCSVIDCCLRGPDRLYVHVYIYTCEGYYWSNQILSFRIFQSFVFLFSSLEISTQSTHTSSNKRGVYSTENGKVHTNTPMCSIQMYVFIARMIKSKRLVYVSALNNSLFSYISQTFCKRVRGRSHLYRLKGKY